MTPQELRKNAEDCLKLVQETDEIYAKMALIEMATEFRVMAEGLEWKATPRTADRITQRVDRVRRGRRDV
jgi:PHD/YefM family antitoxin component YafN of YafNO toxin-antitoxin module